MTGLKLVCWTWLP